MARVPSKRDQNMDFHGFLNDLQDWEVSLKEKDKKLKVQSSQEKKKTGIISEAKGVARKAPSVDYSKSVKSIGDISSKFFDEESTPDAATEKEHGNECFKQKKFNEAIDSYSRSIALSPTAVAFANRAMAYLKLKRFEDAEVDCTEALNLDDRYTKAYSRRATARKELGKLKESFEDSEFALRLEPQNQELKKQYADTKALYDKELLAKASEKVKKSSVGEQRVGSTAFKAVSIKEIESGSTNAKGTIGEQKPNQSQDSKFACSGPDLCKNQVMQNGHKVSKKEAKPSIQELALRAVSQAKTEAAKNIKAPKTAYEFELAWRGLSGDRALQAQLLKAVPPATLPKLFRDALTAPLLIDIVKCISTFFPEETELAVELLDTLTKVPRFNMIIMCLTVADKDDLRKTWDEVFSAGAIPIECSEILNKLRMMYCSGP
ncbi:hypothetical protein Scep_030817 [Stephania cephalantha]|uniref:RNA-polymerase II-associated protein 3-like C-terminal domain-containing protein n=1 Tax=Stephania cephalantha TaxID=152367 RepID=A0AAP0HHA2_9MAGN